MENIVNEWEVFGLQAPTEEPVAEPSAGAQEPEIAEPAAAGAQEPEVAEPEKDVEIPAPEEKTPLTKQERAANAQRRREKEIKDAVDAALQKERQENQARLGKFFAQAKIKNPYADGAEITSLEQAEAWAESDRMAKVSQNLKKGQLNPEDIQTLIEESPVVKQLQQENAQARQQLQQQEGQQFRKTVEMELAEIRKLNPAITSLTDILQMETGKEFARLVQNHGLGYLEAYRFANMDTMVAQAGAVAAVGARTMTAGKDHMTATRPRGDGALEVPADVKANYRALMPGITDEEIQREYQQFCKKQ